MAGSGDLAGENHEVSLLAMSEELRRVGCEHIPFEPSVISGCVSAYPDSSIQSRNTRAVLMLHASDGPVSPSQIQLAPSSKANECLHVGKRCGYTLAPRALSQESNNLSELKDQCKTLLGKNLEGSPEYSDPDTDTTVSNSELAEKGKFCSYQEVCNMGIESSRSKSYTKKDATNYAISVKSDYKNAILGLESSETHLVPLNNVSLKKDPISLSTSTGWNTSSAGGSKESTSLSESDDVGGYNTLKPDMLTNQLIEGPNITVPPSQLPVVPSCPSHLAQIGSDSVCASMDVPGLQNNSDVAVGSSVISTHVVSPHFSSSPTMQSENNIPFSAPGTRYKVAENVESAAVLPAQNNISTSAATAASNPVSEPVRSNLPAAESISSTQQRAKKTPNDFIFGKMIGEGSYSTVYLAKEVSTQREFAIKVCDKKHLIRERKTHFVMREKEVLMKLDHPFFIKLAYTFQDTERLYYVLTYARNGELLGYLRKLSAFDVPCTKFYSAEIVLALEYLHGLGIIHRDLKPENILLSEDMHIKITDFGTSKILSQDSNGNAESVVEAKRKNSFVGTAEYVSPEVLNNNPANYGSDLWALGCIIYQCLSGSLPFRSGNEYQTFQKIVKADYDFPSGFHPQAKDLVQKLLVLDPQARLGMGKPEGMKALKDHIFYEDINWENLPQDVAPKLMPYLPATDNNPEFWGQEQRAGFDEQRLAEIITGQGIDGSVLPELEELPIRVLSQTEGAEKAEKLRKQRLENKFHRFVQDNLIIRQGFVDKRKGLFARKRMLLLTEGPHLYYVDAHNKVLKGEIPWSKFLRPEAKNFKIFFVHTPNRTYYLESRQPDAQQWVKQIKDVWTKYYSNGKEK